MNRSINKLLVGFALSASAMTIVSCGSDYLDTNPTESTSTNTAMATTANAKKALNGIAKSMSVQQSAYTQGFAGENAIIRLYENLPSQDFNYNYYAPGWAPIHNQTLHHRTDSRYDEYAWAYYYQLIGQANSIIANVDKAAGTQQDRDFIKASALTFRAYAFEKLIHYYCYRWEDSNNGTSKGLVLRLDESNGDLALSTLAETYTQIYKDLDDAISLYTSSGEDRKSGSVWLPNINVAHAVYARAALTKHDYSKALSEAQLARQGYDLMTGAEERAGFAKPTSEWIFGSYGDATEQNWYWAFGVQGACNGYYATNTGMQTGAGTIGAELIDRIPNDDARKQMYITPDKFKDASGSVIASRTNSTQVNQTFGLIEKGSNIYTMAADFIKANSPSGFTAAYQSGAYYMDGQLKFWVFDQPGVSYVPFIRSSEMVLIEAEANYFLGNASAAQANLVELNASTGRNSSYTCTKTGTALLEEIQDYRNLELWGEGFEWSDFKRWNKSVVRKTFANGGNAHTAVATTIAPDAGNKWTWDIPKAETDYNQPLTQP